jgi:hypothetical protein
MLESYGGMKRRRYERGLARFSQVGVSRRDARATGFVKVDKFDPDAKVNPDPRMIQYRSPQYCVALGAWLKPLEHFFYTCKNWGAGLPKGRIIAKGLNPHQRGELIASKFGKFKRPVVLSLDASRFDQHVSRELLLLEHGFYLQVTDCPPDFQRLLSYQLDNTTVTSRGVVYDARGRRLSGDMNTAVGNCVLMVGMLAATMREIKVRYDVLDDGDDCLLFLEEEDVQEVRDRLPALFLEYGMEMKLENEAHTLEHVQFCQSRPVLVGGSYVMIPSPRKVLSTMLSGLRFGLSPRLDRSIVGTLGVALGILYEGVPVLQSYAEMLRRSAGSPSKLAWDNAAQEYTYTHWVDMSKSAAVREVEESTRLSFHRAWGLDFGVQIAAENQFASNKLSFSPALQCPLEYQNPGWAHVASSFSEKLWPSESCAGA